MHTQTHMHRNGRTNPKHKPQVPPKMGRGTTVFSTTAGDVCKATTYLALLLYTTSC